MKLPPSKRNQEQLRFDADWSGTKFFGYKASCTAIGNFYEQATYHILKGVERLTTDGTADVCPDLAETKRGAFFVESKSSGGSRFMIVIDQLEMYDEFLSDTYMPDMRYDNPDFEPVILYSFWTHSLRKTNRFSWREELYHELAKSTESVIIVDLEIINRMVVGRPTSADHEMYPSHFNFYKKDMKSINEFANTSDHIIDRCRSITCYGNKIKRIPIKWLLSERAFRKPEIRRCVK